MRGLKSAAAALLMRSCSNNNKSKPSHSSLTYLQQHSRTFSSSSLPNEDDLENQGARLLKLYKAWENDSNIGFVSLKGSGRAFSAGGDIINLYHLINQGKWEECRKFFGTLYTFIYLLGDQYNYTGGVIISLQVAILNGITMGGGTGVSIPGTFRLATNKTVFATPETLIGFHPDAGASFFLSHLPGHLGEYLALTGETLNGAEMIACGLATHYTHSEKLHLVEHHLGELVTDDPSVIESSLEQYNDLVSLDKMSEREAAETNDPWCNSTLRRLKEASPLSLKVALRSIQVGRFQTLDQCLVREYRMSLQGISKQISGDFCEGVRARMVDKDLAPKNVALRVYYSTRSWNPPILEQVTEDMVDRYFSPLSESEPDLDLPTKQREAFT
ncbi:unnamed protein product [Dovyalis caffra]|uniref:3-hydroxyisobutyryl-CoA hydrolase n=1 Tax=Dovyalis caffra TaxID=77055 RepID=A0AAV1S932_9ROSI|nr:unnamed protein product [Dovyalis caffra]